jgi:hypothetical protein
MITESFVLLVRERVFSWQVVCFGNKRALEVTMQTGSVRKDERSGTIRDQLITSGKHSNHWPPLWRWVAGTGNRRLDSESAILQSVAVSEVDGVNRCHLLVEYERSHFVGTLSFEDIDQCLRVYELLLEHCGESIQSIGELTIESVVHSAKSERRIQHLHGPLSGTVIP